MAEAIHQCPVDGQFRLRVALDMTTALRRHDRGHTGLRRRSARSHSRAGLPGLQKWHRSSGQFVAVRVAATSTRSPTSASETGDDNTEAA